MNVSLGHVSPNERHKNVLEGVVLSGYYNYTLVTYDETINDDDDDDVLWERSQSEMIPGGLDLGCCGRTLTGTAMSTTGILVSSCDLAYIINNNNGHQSKLLHIDKLHCINIHAMEAEMPVRTSTRTC